MKGAIFMVPKPNQGGNSISPPWSIFGQGKERVRGRLHPHRPTTNSQSYQVLGHHVSKCAKSKSKI